MWGGGGGGGVELLHSSEWNMVMIQNLVGSLAGCTRRDHRSDNCCPIKSHQTEKWL